MASLFRRYLLDSSVLIGASQQHFKVHDCPEFWRFLIESHNGGEIISSIDKVRDEIAVIKDDLHEWALDAPRTFFASTAQSSAIQAHPQLIKRLRGLGHYSNAAIDEFLIVANSWLIVYARLQNAVVVTEEKRRDKAIARVIIPNVCALERVPCMNLFEMIEELKFRPDDWRDTS